jgi:REase associating with pPIWI_RE
VWSLPEAADAVLIDADYRVPSEDCEVIAQQMQGTSLEDLIEKRLHNDLTQSFSKLGDDADAAYTTIREFIGRHPLATTTELNGLYTQSGLNNAAIVFVQRLYTPVHADVATQGQVHRCHFCNAPVGRDGRCMLQGCRYDHPYTKLTEPIPLEKARVAPPEVLKYWVDPAREELWLYDALRKVGIAVDLYPHIDRCDVAIGEEVGVDVKDYRDPVRLAWKLNQGIGGLLHYPRSILAVADRRAWNGDYIERLRGQLSSENQQRLELRSVSDAIRMLKRDFQRKRGGRARQT